MKYSGLVLPESPDNIIIVSGIWQPLTRMFHELPSRGCGEGCATGQPQGVGPEAYLNSTSQGPTPEDARKDGHIIRARSAPLSPASGFPVSRSQQADSWNIRVLCLRDHMCTVINRSVNNMV